MKNFLIAASFASLLSGCGGAESDAKKAVLDILKDPGSAKFGEFTQVNEDGACLTVNARNSMGGYTGDQQAVLIKDKEGWTAVTIGDGGPDICIKVVQELTSNGSR